MLLALKNRRTLVVDTVAEAVKLCSDLKPPNKINFAGRIVAFVQQTASTGKLLTKVALFDKDSDVNDFKELEKEVKNFHDFSSIAEHFFVITFFGEIPADIEEKLRVCGSVIQVSGVNSLRIHSSGPVGVGMISNVNFE